MIARGEGRSRTNEQSLSPPQDALVNIPPLARPDARLWNLHTDGPLVRVKLNVRRLVGGSRPLAAEDERSVNRRAPEGDRLGQRVGVPLKETGTTQKQYQQERRRTLIEVGSRTLPLRVASTMTSLLSAENKGVSPADNETATLEKGQRTLRAPGRRARGACWPSGG